MAGLPTECDAVWGVDWDDCDADRLTIHRMKMSPSARRRRCRIFGLILTGALSTVATVGSSQSVPIHEKNVGVRMRDGVVLRADVLRPLGDERHPTLVYRTPYGKDPALDGYTTF